MSQSYHQSLRPGMHISPKRGIGRFPKHKGRTSVQKLRNDMTKTERSVWTCCRPALITSSELHGWSSAVCSDATTRLYETLITDLPVNQIKNTDNLDSPRVPLTLNRVWLMFGPSKSAENKTWSAVRPLTKWLFSLRSHGRGWSGSILVSPALASVWEHPAVFEARSSHSHWPWTVCSPPHHDSSDWDNIDGFKVEFRIGFRLGLGA